MSAAALHTALVDRLGCRWPIVQTAMGWVAEPPLVIASCEAGAFGFLGAAVMTPPEAREKLLAVRRGTERPFGVNFHAFQPGAGEIVDLVIANRAQVRAVSFGRGPDARMIGRLREAGVLCVPTVGAVRHAEKMAQLGVDMITVQGGEGGGHTGSVPTTVLLPQVLDAVGVPVIAAGGFADGRGLAAALAYGAVGIAMGTRFLMTRESPAAAAAKAEYVRARTDNIVVTSRLDGVPQRMLRTPMLDRIERAGRVGMWARAVESGLVMKRMTGAGWGDLLRAARAHRGDGMTLAQAMMAASMPVLIQRAIVQGDVAGGVLATGVVGGRIGDLPSCQELVTRIVAEAEARLAALAGRQTVDA